MTPALDVVIPTLNTGSALPGTLAALRVGQSRFSSTITVCDGGSGDDTVALATRDGAAIVTAPPGRGGQLATGAAVGSAPWLLFLHADTVLADGWTEAVQHFVSAPASIAKAGYFRLRFASTDPRARRVERQVAWRCRTFGLPYGDQGLLMARSFYRHLGGFRPLPLMEDVDLVRRIGRDNLVPLAADAVTSPARYERDGWLARPTRNLLCLALYFAGVSPRHIARLYDR
ncbi:MAG: TIGR04283 family arsenosugar biosynthesis glycosyltransferase [Reyranellales bacterium]